MNKLTLIALLAATTASCGDNLKAGDAGTGTNDGSSSGGFPAAPTLGPQIDRLGRPAINTALNHGFDANATMAGMAKDSYNQDSSRGGWPAAYATEFAHNLAILDALDTGLTCSAATGCALNNSAAPGSGCGNQVMYNGALTGGGAPMMSSYAVLAGTLADDVLYLDTTKTSSDLPNHQNYLAVEINVLTQGGQPNATSGGRAPTNDVIDTSYSALTVGLGAFSATFDAAIGDGVGPHTDVSNDTFPFLGTPHS